MPLEFNRATKIAELPITDGADITVQSVYDQFKDFEDEPRSMDLNRMISAGGKTPLGGGRFTVVTITLLDGWLLAFEERIGPGTTQTTVSDGNIVAEDEAGDPQFPIFPTAFTAVTIAQATTGAIIEVGVGGATAQEIWDYAGPFASAGIGDFIKRQVLTIAKFFQIVK
jgi:hypothetical protein